MRIAVICPNYKQGRSYQENIWAEQLAAMGHVVRVIYSGTADSEIRRFQVQGGAYETRQVRTKFLPRSTFSSSNVHEHVREFAPELIVIYGDKLFSRPIARDRGLRHVPVISTYSENLGMHEFDWRKPGISLKQRLWALGFILMRAGPIREVCRRSALIVGNTPQAREIILRLFSRSERDIINPKIVDMPLGFSPDDFGFRPALRQRVRAELAVRDDEIVVCASSHFSPAKAPYLMMIIDALREVMKSEPMLRAIIVGFSNEPKNQETTDRINAYLDSGPYADRFIRHPFAGRERLCELYNASDIAAFGRASISCQEALGTGLFVVFADDGSLNHLVTLPDQGVFFRPGDKRDLADKIAEGLAIVSPHQGEARHAFRYRLVQASRWLGYDRIIESILQRVAVSNAPQAATSLRA